MTVVLYDLGGALWHKSSFSFQEWKALDEALLWYPVTLTDPAYVYKICHKSLAIQELYYVPLYEAHFLQALKVFFSPFMRELKTWQQAEGLELGGRRYES